jgi:hypothetical protein
MHTPHPPPKLLDQAELKLARIFLKAKIKMNLSLAELSHHSQKQFCFAERLKEKGI